MTRRTQKDPFARVCELYAFDENLAVPPPRIPLSPCPPFPAFPVPRSPFRVSLLSPRLALAGFDEAGRGALAGPVAVGCVHFDLPAVSPLPRVPVSPRPPLYPSPCLSLLAYLAGVDDSKRLSPARREEMYRRITEVSSWGVGWASAQEIDRLGIVPAVSLAARRAYSMMGHRVDLLLCDRGISLRERETRRRGDTRIGTRGHGDTESCLFPVSPLLRVPASPPPLELSFTKGDSRSLHIAAASILAKVSRDRVMLTLHQRFPVYGFAANKGYGTLAHLAALRDNGHSAIHRRSFRVKP